MTKKTWMNNFGLIILASVCVLAGCQKKEPVASESKHQTHEQQSKSMITPIQKAQAMLNVVGLDAEIKEKQKSVVATFSLSGKNPLLDAVLKSGMITGAVARNFKTDKPLFVIGLLDGEPASAFEIELDEAQKFLEGSAEFSNGQGFKVVDVQTLKNLL